MINNDTLLAVQDSLMDAMTALYLADRNDEFAGYLAANMVAIHEQIEIELMERALV